MRRSFVVAVPAVAAAVTAVALLPGSGAAQSGGERTFKLAEKSGSFTVVDNPPRDARKKGPSPGDEIVFTNKLYDTSNKRVGTVSASCVFPPPRGNETVLCTGVFKLADGTLTGTTLSSANGLTTVIAITGGTGAYEGARGSVTSVARSHADNAPSDDTIHLLG